MMLNHPALHYKLTRILPHIVDTLLLISAITLVIMSRQYPLASDWVTLKVGLLFVYILLGTFALKRGKTLAARRIFFVAALLTILAIFWTAIVKPVTPF